MSISGAVLFPPYYADDTGTTITSIDFNFQNYADPDPNNHVNSDTKYVQVVDAVVYPATVNVTPPTGCSIGASPIADNQLRLIFTSKTIRNTGGTVDFDNGVVQSVRFRFRRQGNYASLTGVVSCSTTGQMIYTY